MLSGNECYMYGVVITEPYASSATFVNDKKEIYEAPLHYLEPLDPRSRYLKVERLSCDNGKVKTIKFSYIGLSYVIFYNKILSVTIQALKKASKCQDKWTKYNGPKLTLMEKDNTMAFSYGEQLTLFIIVTVISIPGAIVYAIVIYVSRTLSSGVE